MSHAILRVRRADNELMAFLNGVLVYDKKTEGDPTFNDAVPLPPLSPDGGNLLLLVGVNWGGPACFKGQVELPCGAVVPFEYSGGSTPNGMCWHQAIPLA